MDGQPTPEEIKPGFSILHIDGRSGIVAERTRTGYLVRWRTKTPTYWRDGEIDHEGMRQERQRRERREARREARKGAQHEDHS